MFLQYQIINISPDRISESVEQFFSNDPTVLLVARSRLGTVAPLENNIRHIASIIKETTINSGVI